MAETLDRTITIMLSVNEGFEAKSFKKKIEDRLRNHNHDPSRGFHPEYSFSVIFDMEEDLVITIKYSSDEFDTCTDLVLLDILGLK